MIDRNLAALRRVSRLIEVVQATHGSRHSLIEFNDDLIRQAAECRHITYAGRRDDLDLVTFFDDLAGLDDGEIRLRHEAVAKVLREFRKVHVKIMCPLCVEFGTQVFVTLVRRAELNGMRAS